MIRKFKFSDLPRILEIEKKSFKNPWLKWEFKWWWFRKNFNFLVYEIEDRVVGYIIFSSRGDIANIAVDLNYRRKGIATKLVKEVIDEIDQAQVEVRESNQIAQKFYQSLGFRKKTRIPKYYGDEDAWVMLFNIDRKKELD